MALGSAAARRCVSVMRPYADDHRSSRSRYDWRNDVGRPTYRELARRSGYSASALKAAARGERLPTLPVAVAFAAACGADEQEWESPYLGLAAYQLENADRFFGRDRLVADLLALLKDQTVVAVVGPSGSGKSSLLRAGVIPAARRRPVIEGLPVSAAVFTPGCDPTRALDQALAHGSEWAIHPSRDAVDGGSV